MNRMRLACFSFALCAASWATNGAAAESVRPHPLLGQVHKVYLLGMGGGLDQHMAHQLTAKGVLEVVTDPKLADAVLSESIGTDFEARLNELLPPPKPQPEPAAASTKKGRESAETQTVVPATTIRTSSFSRGRGNVFLVDLKSRSVVWSTYQLPKRRTPEELDRAAERIVNSLNQDLSKK